MGLQRVRHDRATELNPLLSLFISLINYPRFSQWSLLFHEVFRNGLIGSGSSVSLKT